MKKFLDSVGVRSEVQWKLFDWNQTEWMEATRREWQSETTSMEADGFGVEVSPSEDCLMRFEEM